MEIDWSKAPEGATHGRKTYDGHNWYKIVDGDFCYLTRQGYWQPAITSMAECTIRPGVTEWTGDGLPPVGLLCEAYYHNDTRPGWKPFTLKYLSDDHVIFKGLGETVVSREQFDRCVADQFRPLRTAEQIAAEEREAELNRMVATVSMLDKGWARKVCARLYDAGYRKFEIVEDDACPD